MGIEVKRRSSGAATTVGLSAGRQTSSVWTTGGDGITRWWRKVVKLRALYVMALPVLVCLVVLRYWPMVLQFMVAFKDYQLGRGIFGSRWVGFANFVQVFTTTDFLAVLRNTIVISLLRLLVGFLPPLILAILLNDLWSKRFRRIAQTLIYIPHFFSWVIIYGLAYSLFAPGSGMVNRLLVSLGHQRIDFLTSPAFFRPMILGTALFKELGWGTIIYLAALSAIDPQLYEAAAIDGAGPIKRLIHITLPSVRDVVIFLFTIALGFILNAGGEQVLLFVSGPTMRVGDIIDTWVYRHGLVNMEYSFATAAGLFQSFFGLILVVVANNVARRYAGRGIW